MEFNNNEEENDHIPNQMYQKNNDDESVRSACAACRHQRKKCREGDCILWRHFPASKMEDFQAVHRVFGISNISKMIKGLDPVQQDHTVKSFLWEAKSWIEDPVHGPLGRFNRLEHELMLVKNETIMLQQQLVTVVAPPALVTRYQSGSGGGSSVGNFGYNYPNYLGQHRMNHGYQVPTIQPNFGFMRESAIIVGSDVNSQNNYISNASRQDVTSMVTSRPQQQHLASPHQYNISFIQTRENANVINPYPNNNVRINNVQDSMSVIHAAGDHRTSNNVVGRNCSSVLGRQSKLSNGSEERGDGQIVGHEIAEEDGSRDLATLYYCQQLLSNNNNQNNVQRSKESTKVDELEDPTWKKN